ncbi:MAG: haloacid dehalogenase-like hydrolase [Candidatus Acidiferrum sp.]|jgi:phosphoserine phosphatase
MSVARASNQPIPASGNIAAFFDLDGTLLPLPSLERRFAAALKFRHAIPAGNYFRWLAQAIRLAPHGIGAITRTNKMYLHNVSANRQTLLSSTGTLVYAEQRNPYAGVHHAVGASLIATRNQLPTFFPDAIDRIVWHIECGHAIVLVTGTLAPLANEATLVLTLRLAARGITTSIAVCATQLEQANDRWTGRIKGEAMFGAAKVRAAQRIATQKGFDLAGCYAYGDSTNDRWMLGAVGRPAAVNPSRELERIARLRNWPILRWDESAAPHAGQSAPVAAPFGGWSLGETTAKTQRQSTLSGKRIANIKSESLG